MIFLDKSSKLANVIIDHHQVIPVISRFGIKLGVGDNTIGEICDEANINIDFFLVILNTFLNEDYFPEKKLKAFDLELVVSYLKQADMYMINAQLHNLEKHLNAFVTISDPNNKQLILIAKLFNKFKEEIINQSEQGLINGEPPLALLVDLKSIIIKHISGSFNENMCYAVIFSIDSIEKDLYKHNRIREKILQPLIKELEDMGVSNWKELIGTENISINEKSTISQREIDVLRLVALGNINKEIADKLNISLNTVLTHRKNITAKLGIKTVSGLIFYCITNGLLSGEEIEF